MSDVWKLVQAQVPDALLDETNKSPEEYKKALARCYGVIVPSLSDVSPNTALEALSYGKPAIVTRDTGIRYLASDALMFVDTRNPSAIAQAVIALCSPSVYERALRAAGTMPETATWERYTQQLRARLFG